MPSLFGKRHSTSNAPNNSNVSSNASIAATSAFLRSAPSNPSLSSAAAAAALRSHVTTPEPVGSLQTKRMVRRGSVSSVGSNAVPGRPASRGALVRQNSSGSMTERTFRSPSPGRDSPRGAVPAAYDAPPVPSLPGHKRSSSVEPPPMRVTSPEPRRGGRGVSVDRTSFAGQARAQRISSLPKLPELERENSRGSVNFSRPYASPQPSPPESPVRPKSSGGSWFTSPTNGNSLPRQSSKLRPTTSDGLSQSETRSIQRNLQEVASKPVSTKKTKAVDGSQGSRLATGTMAARPQSPVQVPQAATLRAAQQAASTPFTEIQDAPKTKKKPAMIDTADVQPPPRNPARVSPTSPRSPRAAGLLHKQPSIVREDPEEEAFSDAQQESSVPQPASVANSSTTKSGIINTSEGPAIPYHSKPANLDVPREYEEPSTDVTSRGHDTLTRQRSAHFSSSLVDGSTGTRHIPPPRSISPAKSAMKHSPASSVRGNSPMTHARSSSANPRAPSSETSDTVSNASQDGIKPKKKKSVRVSFDQSPVTNQANGESTHLRAAASAGTADSDDADDMMKPRPALPSFGSVRNQETRSQPQMAKKVTETLPSTASSRTNALPEQQGSSSDQLVGSILANEQASKPAVPSQQESLAPQVTSVEGSGYQSDSSAYSQHEDSARVTDQTKSEPLAGGVKTITLAEYLGEPEATQPAPATTAETFQPPITTAETSQVYATTSETSRAPATTAETSRAPATTAETLPSPATTAETSLAPAVIAAQAAAAATLPDINVLPATPGLEEEVKDPVQAQPTLQRSFSIPGAWDTDEDGNKTASKSGVQHNAPEASAPSASVEDDEQRNKSQPLTAESLSMMNASQLRSLDAIDESDSDDSAAFSDAAEDPSEFDNGGFASLDAIVESPLPKASPAARDLSKDVEEPAEKEEKADWNDATAYWSSLSKTHREQLERQAAAAKAATPAVAAAAPPPKKKTKAPQAKAAPAARAPPTQQKSVPPRISSAGAEKPTAMKKSMRGPAPASSSAEGPTTHMRSSMRSDAPLKTSMRTQPAPSQRPQSAVYPEARSTTLQKKTTRPASTVYMGGGGLPSSAAAASMQPKAKAAPPPKLMNNDSDSESSFRKKRRPSTSTVDGTNRYSMKRSMRAASLDMAAERRPMSPSGPPPKSSRWSVRSMSPPASEARNRESIRSTLRGSSVVDTPTMRGKGPKGLSAESKARESKSPSRFGFAKASKPASTPTSAGKAKPALSSRFGDSDSDDDAAPRGGYRSRFSDSDDEDLPVAPPRSMPAELTPVRGIPRRSNLNDEDSSDLEDSDEELVGRTNGRNGGANRASAKPLVPSQADIDAAMAIARRNVAAMTGSTVPDGSPGTDVPETPTKKHVTLQAGNGINGAQPKPAEPVVDPGLNRRRGIFGSIFGGRKRSESSSTIPRLDSQSVASPPRKVDNSVQPQSPASVRPGKLQRRNTPQLQRMTSDMSAVHTLPGTPSRTAVPDVPAVPAVKDATPASPSQSSTNWPLAPPLPPPIPESAPDTTVRPSTSDGLGAGKDINLPRTMRPDVARRTQSGLITGTPSQIGSNGLERPVEKAQTPAAVAAAAPADKTAKKKKFGKWRKAFGLND